MSSSNIKYAAKADDVHPVYLRETAPGDGSPGGMKIDELTLWRSVAG